MCSVAAPATRATLRAELLAMDKADQGPRMRLLAEKDSKKQQAIWAEMFRNDAQNQAKLKAIVAKWGWPGKSLVGKQASDAAWEVLQHTTEDKPFMRKCLPMLVSAMDRGDAERPEVALLVDRVLVGEGKKQLYGSQFAMDSSGKMTANPIQDPAHLDERRRAMHLPPFAVYEKELQEMYKNVKPPVAGPATKTGGGK